MRQIAIMALAFCIFGAMAAMAQDCSSITADKDRLACYDALRKSNPETATSEVTKSPASRAGYAGRLRRFFLSNEIDMEVVSEEKVDPRIAGYDAFPQYPKLFFFGYINAPFVYQAITKASMLSNAKALGFKGLQFMSKGTGAWFFDISAAISRCDTRHELCI